MNRTPRSLVYPAALAASVLGLVSPAALADQILQVFSTPLTAYKGGATQQQGVQPQAIHRGVGIDGSARAASGYSWAFAGNPFGDAMSPVYRIGDVNLATGAYSPTEIDIALPGPGASRVVIGRTYNGRSATTNGTHRNSNGYQGYNWQQIAHPELVYYTDGGDAANNTIYLVYGADRHLEFKRTGSSSDYYQGRNGAAGVIERVEVFDEEIGDDIDYYIYYDQHGTKTYFLGSLNIGTNHKHQFWKIVDAAGNTSYVGSTAGVGLAIAAGYDSFGRIEKMYDAAGRRYYHTYSGSTIGGNYRLEQVLVETDAGGGWGAKGAETLVGQVDYAYYTSTDDTNDTGLAGDLKQVTVTTPLTDTTVATNRYYRYYTRAWSNADGRRGEAHKLRMAVGAEGWRRREGADGNFGNDTIGSDSDSTLKSFSEVFIEYADTGGSSPYRISKVFANGECGCGGGGANGSYTFTYSDNGSHSATGGYDADWKSRAIAAQPDGSYTTYYFDECGQPLSRVVTDADPSGSPTKTWFYGVDRSSAGCVEFIHTPKNATAYTHSTGTPTYSDSVGLVHYFERETGDLTGFLKATRFQEGFDDDPVPSRYYLSYTGLGQRDFEVTSGVEVTRPVITARRAYHTAGTSAGSNYDETAMSYAWWSSTASSIDYITLKQVTTTLPAVTTGKNGSNASNTTDRYLRKDGTTFLSRSADGIYDYTKFTNGQLVKHTRDAKTNGSFSPDLDPNADFGITESATGSDRHTLYSYDAQGRPLTTTLPTGRVMGNYYSKLLDRRMVSLSWPRVDGSARHGPASYSVANHSGKSEFSGVVASAGLTDALSTWINEAEADPMDALEKGELKSMRTMLYDDAGHQLTEERAYFTLPSGPTFGAGNSTNNYDPTAHAYDVMGRRHRSVTPAGTIHKTTFDELGRTSTTQIGTDDGVSTPNMVTTSEMVYDGGGTGMMGNSHLTSRKLFIQDNSTGQRVTTYTHDLRGRVLLTTNPQAPHVLTKYDNLSRSLATALYSVAPPSTADPTGTATDDKTNRMAISTAAYDELGRVYQTTRYEVNQSTGLVDENVASLTWYDAAGRVTKVKGESAHEKHRYDRLGRRIQTFTLATDNDSTYSDAGTLSGDIVLRESQTAYASTDSDNVLMAVSIDRHYDDLSNGTTGELDLDADGAEDSTLLILTAVDVKGRVQITSMWYDELDRVTDTVRLGTNGIVGDRVSTSNSYDRGGAGSPPSRSPTALRTTTVYDSDGTTLSVTDPKALVTQFEYDRLFRQTKVIRNYVNGTPSSDTADDDQTVTYGYLKGHRATITADLSTDQVTRYIYGATKGTPTQMKIASNDLLRAIKYPDTTNTSATTGAHIDSDSSDVVSFAYNAQGQVTYTKDQAGNIIETTFDTGGREELRAATTIDSDFDDYVQAIWTEYDGLGRVWKVTQIDQPVLDGSTVRDQVAYTYDDWGNLYAFIQDPDSAIGGSGRADFGVAYTHAKASPSGGAVRVRRATYTAPSVGYLTYEYSSASNCLDDAASRVTTLDLSTVDIATYKYTGPDMLVWTRLPEASVANSLLDGSPAYSDRLDRFNRVISSNWGSSRSGTSYYDVAIAYDENSNIVSTQDNLKKSGSDRTYDVAYSLDSLNRLLQADEGQLSGSTIDNSKRTRREAWTLDQVGNWAVHKLDHTGGATPTHPNYTDSAPFQEFQETRTHNLANELLLREQDTNATTGAEITYDPPDFDPVGNMLDDDKDYAYKWDPFGRLRYVYETGTTDVVEEIRYNGLNHRIGFSFDTDLDTDVDGSDLFFWHCYDERWRIVATFRADDTGDSGVKEAFVYHAAGAGGLGGSSYIDSVVLRDKDASTDWLEEADGPDSRVYYCQNWRADVSALLSDGGKLIETVKYSSYGVPTGFPVGDINADGAWDATDDGLITAAIGNPNPLYDTDLDGGNIDAADVAWADSITGGYQTLGRGVLTSTAVANRKGYAGYEGDNVLLGNRHAQRHRWYDADLGQWLKRDPAGYVDGTNLYEMAGSLPPSRLDPLGLFYEICERVAQNVTPVQKLERGSPCERQSEGTPLCNDICKEEGEIGNTRCYWLPGHIRAKQCCVCDKNIESLYGESKEAAAAVIACTERHEKMHRDKQRWCVLTNRQQACCELEPTLAELRCLREQRQQGNCNARCRELIDRRINNVDQYYRDNLALCLHWIANE